MLDFVQQLVSGTAVGCVYGLIALGFVLIYKATEVVNFAQGELMMLGGFFAFTFIGLLGLNYWIGFFLAVLAMAALGAGVERVIVRPILGYPAFSIVMATIGLSFFARSIAGMIWGTDDLKIDTPFTAGVVRLELRSTKNGEARVFPFDVLPELAEVLRRQRFYTDGIELVNGGSSVAWVFHRSGRPIKDYTDAWRKACAAAGVPGRIPHDFRRTAVRNLLRAGVPESWAMKLTGHKTPAVFRRYAITNEADLREAVGKLAASFARTLTVR